MYKNIMKLNEIIESSIREFLSEQYQIASEEQFEDALLDLNTLDLEDDQVRYPKIDGREQELLFGGSKYDLFILDKNSLPSSGPFEILIDDGDVIGFIRGTKKDDMISFNLIYIEDEHRGAGIGTEIYKDFLDNGYVIKSDSEITGATYSIYDSLVSVHGYKPIVFKDGRVGVKK